MKQDEIRRRATCWSAGMTRGRTVPLRWMFCRCRRFCRPLRHGSDTDVFHDRDGQRWAVLILHQSAASRSGGGLLSALRHECHLGPVSGLQQRGGTRVALLRNLWPRRQCAAADTGDSKAGREWLTDVAPEIHHDLYSFVATLNDVHQSSMATKYETAGAYTMVRLSRCKVCDGTTAGRPWVPSESSSSCDAYSSSNIARSACRAPPPVP